MSTEDPGGILKRPTPNGKAEEIAEDDENSDDGLAGIFNDNPVKKTNPTEERIRRQAEIEDAEDNE